MPACPGRTADRERGVRGLLRRQVRIRSRTGIQKDDGGAIGLCRRLLSSALHCQALHREMHLVACSMVSSKDSKHARVRVDTTQKTLVSCCARNKRLLMPNVISSSHRTYFNLIETIESYRASHCHSVTSSPLSLKTPCPRLHRPSPHPPPTNKHSPNSATTSTSDEALTSKKNLTYAPESKKKKRTSKP